MTLLAQKLFKKETVVASAAFVFTLTIVEKVTTLVRGVIFARILGPVEYGTYNLAFFIIPLAVIFAKLGLPSCYERYIAQYEKKGELGDFLKRNYRLTIFAAIFISVFLFVFSGWFSTLLYDSKGYKHIIMLCALSIVPVTMHENYLASFNGLRIFKMSSLLRFNQIAVFTVLGIILVFIHPKAISVVAANLVSFILISIVFGIIVWKHVLNSDSQGNLIQGNDFYKKMFRYSSWFIITPLVTTLFRYTDRLILNHFMGLHEVGIYSAALNISQIVFMVGMIAGNVLMPNLSSILSEGNREKVILILNFAIKFIILLILSYSVIFVIFQREIMFILYGNKFISAHILFPFLLIFWLSSSLVWLIGIYPLLIEKSYLSLIAAFPGLVLNISLNYVLIPLYGIIGAAIAALCSHIFILLLLLILCKRKGMSLNINTIILLFTPFILLFDKLVMLAAFIFLVVVSSIGKFFFTDEEKKIFTDQFIKPYNKLFKRNK